MAAKSKPSKFNWLPEPQKHDYPAAASYLSLTHEPNDVDRLVKRLKKAGMSEFAAKDIFRASGLPLLDATNYHVKKDRAKIAAGELVSPLLLVRHPELGRVIIADGYHRMCAVYTYDEDARVPCKIV